MDLIMYNNIMNTQCTNHLKLRQFLWQIVLLEAALMLMC